MADTISGVGATAAAGSSGAAASGSITKGGAVGKDEFLMMLVTQLKNQDPLDPMKNEDFAVNLAQFSQLEQLIDIKNAVSDATGDVSSMASLLGKDVAFPGDEVSVEAGDGGSVHFQSPGSLADAEVQVMSYDGTVLKTIPLGALAAGRHNVPLKDLGIGDGTYKVQVVGKGFSGVSAPIDFNVGGTVTGLVPGENPTLLVGEREIKLSEVSMVA